MGLALRDRVLVLFWRAGTDIFLMYVNPYTQIESKLAMLDEKRSQ